MYNYNTSIKTNSVQCQACGMSTNYIIDGLCLDCAYKKMQIDMVKVPQVNNYGQAWICPKCGMVHGPNSQTCWCNAKLTCSCSTCSCGCSVNSSEVTQDMFVPHEKSVKE